MSRRLSTLCLYIAGLSLTINTGCGGFGGNKYRGPRITHPPFVQDISEEADRLAQSSKLLDKIGAVDLYCAVENITGARPVAREILGEHPSEGLRAYNLLQKLINENPELAEKN